DEGIAWFDGELALLGIMEPGNPHGLRVSTGDFHANGAAYAGLAKALAPWLASSGLPFDSTE
ncbi:MAG: hypothetical protein P1V35_13840, partial [Planctomycetota bacterium]|nr:hypothetical protein [Planctomycetota bacterium]